MPISLRSQPINKRKVTIQRKCETCPAHQIPGIAKRLTENERRNNILTLEYIQRIRVQHRLPL